MDKKYYYSPEKNGFFESGVAYKEGLPEDCIEISLEQRDLLVNAVCNCNQVIVIVEGVPTAVGKVRTIDGLKELLKKELSAYRWSITHYTAGGSAAISYVNGFPITHTEDARSRLIFTVSGINAKLASGAREESDTERFKTVDGSWTDVALGTVVKWPEMLAETEQVFFEKEEVVEQAIAALADVDAAAAFNVIAELDDLVKPVLESDLEKYAIPSKYSI